MGKRKHHDEEDYLARKIRKLEKKMSRVRRKQRERSNRSSSLEYNQCSDDDQSSVSLQEAPQNEGALLYEEVHLSDAASHPKADVLSCTPGPASDTVPTTPLPTSVDTPALEDALMEGVQELEPDILRLLGEESVREEKLGDEIHKDVASRWSDILINGLKDDTKTEILKIYSIPSNLKLVQAPALNPEIKAAVNEGALKRDNILAEKQKVLSTDIACVANVVTSILNTGSRDEKTLKSLSDAGRLLCHIHYNESQTRRNFLFSCLNKEVRDSVKDLKRDDLLFGYDLQDKLKSIKAIIKTGTELKPTNKPKVPPKNAPKDSTSNVRALNWRGPPPPQQSQPRRMPARQSSTAGGHKQRITTRRTTDRRAPRQYNRTARR